MKFVFAFLSAATVQFEAASSVLAHARWFIVDDPIPDVPSFSFDSTHAFLLCAAACIIGAGILLDRAAASRPTLSAWLYPPIRLGNAIEWRLLSIAFGSTLILSSMSQFLVAPDMPLGRGWAATTIAFLQIVLGAMYVLQSRLLLASLVTIVVLPLSCIVFHSLGSAIDYSFELIGIGCAMLLVASLISSVDERTLAHALKRISSRSKVSLDTTAGPFHLQWRSGIAESGAPLKDSWQDDRYQLAALILRLMLGLQLVVLAVHDKLWFPGTSLAFVDKHPFVNIPAMLGFENFSNLHFVIGAGMVEVAFGTMLITGVAVRVTSFFLLSVFTLTGLVFGIHELVGHLPIMAALVVMAMSGSPMRTVAAATPEPAKASFVLSGSLAAAAVIVSTGFLLNAPRSSPETMAINAASVPQALYRRFVESRPEWSITQPDLKRAFASVRTAIQQSDRGMEVDKDDMARRLFELSVRHEMSFGRDRASAWLHYAHLTATCTHDDLLAFRMLVTTQRWQEQLQRAPRALVEELTPIARRAAEAILNRRIPHGDSSFWIAAAGTAPTNGPLFVHTHTIAAIARIIDQAATDSERWVHAALDGDKG